MKSPSDRGELAIVLHSHMPYVEGFGTWPFGEEWLFEAIASAYLPLIARLERWADAGEQSILTVGVTPVLADQLALPAVGERFVRFMRETRAESHRLDIDGLERTGQGAAADALRVSARDYERAVERFESLDRNLPARLRQLESAGVVELWASAATHPVLPLLATEAGVRLQVLTGIDGHGLRFGSWSGGFWLPECAFRAGLEEQLSAAGVRAFCVDQTDGSDPLESLEPIRTGWESLAMPIDWRTISLVWDDRGYPADPLYRDYHVHTPNGLRPFANSGHAYDAAAGRERARVHARHFVSRVIERLDSYRSARGRPGLVVCALDTELLGHWWYEGPAWLDGVVEAARESKLPLTSLPLGLERLEPSERNLRESSWGVGKDLGTWDSPLTAELIWPARKAELDLTGALASGAPLVGSAERAARELLALQSSDWAFMAARSLAADYPQRRVAGHAQAFVRALAPLTHGVTDFRQMSDLLPPELRGLAPALRISTMVEPGSGWGRSWPDPIGSPE